MKKILAGFFFIWAVVFLFLFVFVIAHTAVERALTYMTVSLFVIWVLIGGSMMLIFKKQLQGISARAPFGWKKKFVLCATLFALLEEAVTTTLTNVAPLFGAKIGEAYITASTNYIDVVLFHSVIVFVPMFIVWSVLLSWYEFKPFSVFVLFGITGIIAELFITGPTVILAAGFWIYVYGLMVYLPASAVPADRGAQVPRVWHYVLAIFLPILFSIPVAVLINIIHPYQPTHFLHAVNRTQ